jgi:DNA invertase Pin-like site-specific DNA recombinase
MPETRKPRCILYARFSNAVQEGGTSIERQIELAQTYAARNGLELDQRLTLRDLGVSAFHGRNADEGALGEFLKLLQAGDIPPGSTLLMESVSRLSRMPPRKASRILEEIVEGRVGVVFLDSGQQYTLENIDDLATDIRFRVESHAAHKFSADLQRYRRAAWKRVRDRARESRAPGTRMTPGWIHVSATPDARGRMAHGKAELIPDRAKIVRRIFREYLSGRGKELIAKGLNADKIDTWGVGKRKPHRWWHSYIAKLLRSRAALGEYQPHTLDRSSGKAVRAAAGPPIPLYPPVVDADTFNRVQALLSANRPLKGAKLHTSRSEIKHVLATLARCPLCDSAMLRENKGHGEPKYICTGVNCDPHRVLVKKVEEALVAQADTLARNMPATDPALGDELDALDHLLGDAASECEHMERQLAAMTVRKEAIPTAFAKHAADLEAKRDALAAQFQATRAQLSQNETRFVRKRTEDMVVRLKWYGTDPTDILAANASLRECFEKVVIDWQQGLLRFHWRHGPEPTEIIFDEDARVSHEFRDLDAVKPRRPKPKARRRS